MTLPCRQVERNGRKAPLPAYQTAGAAAMDVHAFLDEPVTIQPGCRALIPTGLCYAVPQGFAMLLLARSGLSIKQGICLANSVGLIDSDYRGEVQVGLLNTSNVPFTVHDGDRIAQFLLMGVPKVEVFQCDTLDETARGTGGFGSTGV
jgi:dUTP pyrophosphatase